MSESAKYYDSNGRRLTDGQAKFFWDSAVRDGQGRLLVCYHGSNESFSEFDPSKASGGFFGKGFYFSKEEEYASDYGTSVGAYYLNIENPFYYDESTMEDVRKILDLEIKKGKIDGYDEEEMPRLEQEWYDKGLDLIDDVLAELAGGYTGDTFSEDIMQLGYDGILVDYGREIIVFSPNQIKRVDNTNPTDSDRLDEKTTQNVIFFGNPTKRNDMRATESFDEAYEPMKTGKAYKVFRVKNGKLYPPMVANAGGRDTPIGVWLDAEEGEFAGLSKTGRPQVKSTGSGTLSYRPGWHLGDLPRAPQFDRTNKETGEKEFPSDFVWAECDYAMDVDYQPEADARGYERTKMGDDGKVVTYKSDKYQHSLAGLPKLPAKGYYRYRTNPNPETVPWVITGSIRVNRLLSDDEVNAILKDNGVAPIHRQGGDKTLAELGLSESLSEASGSGLDEQASRRTLTSNDFLGWVEALSDKDDISYNSPDSIEYSDVLLLSPEGDMIDCGEYDTHESFVDAVMETNEAKEAKARVVWDGRITDYLLEKLGYITLNSGQGYGDDRLKIVICRKPSAQQIDILKEWLGNHFADNGPTLHVYTPNDHKEFDPTYFDKEDVTKGIIKAFSSGRGVFTEATGSHLKGEYDYGDVHSYLESEFGFSDDIPEVMPQLIDKDGRFCSMSPKSKPNAPMFHGEILQAMEDDGIVATGDSLLDKVNLTNTDLFQRLGFIRCNRGSEGYHYMALPDAPTANQMRALKRYVLDSYSDRRALIEISGRGEYVNFMVNDDTYPICGHVDDLMRMLVRYANGRPLRTKTEARLSEEWLDDEHGIWMTESQYEVANMMRNSKHSLRILWDRNLKLFFVCDADLYIHRDMIEQAVEDGLYNGVISRWGIDSYVDDYGRNVIYYIFAPKGLEKETYGADVNEDGYEGKYIYPFGTVTTRSDDRYKSSPLAKALGKYEAHYVQDGWVDDYTPKVVQVESMLTEVYPNEGESKKDFVSRFMSVTKDEYPDVKQRYAVALSYWDRAKRKNESLLTEKKRGELISQSKKGADYSKNNQSKGRNRWERRMHSRVANSVRDYDRIDMNALWKADILEFGVKVHGETDDYVVTITFEKILDNLRQEVRSNGNKMEFKCVLRALMRSFNDDDVFISCSCPDWKYRFSYQSTIGRYNSGLPELRPSDITNPNNDKGAGCKHSLLVLSNTDWMVKIASVINNYARYCQKNMQKNYADYIFPKIYGMPYKKAVQLSLFDDMDPDKSGLLPSDQKALSDVIELGMRGKDEKGRFEKGNDYRFAKTKPEVGTDQEDENPLELRFDNNRRKTLRGPEEEEG